MPDTHQPDLARHVPPGRALGSLALIRAVIRNPLEALPREAFEQPIARRTVLGRERYFVTSPEMIQEVLLTQADAFAKSEAMRRALAPALGDAILTADGDRWRWQRRAVAPIFRPDRVQSFLSPMIEAAARTRDRWLALPPGTEIELGHEMMRMTFDIIVETMLSGHAAIDVARVENGITTYLESTGWAIAFAMVKAPGWTPFPGQRRAARARDYLRGELLRLVSERRRLGSEREDLIALLLAARDPESGQAMDDRDIADNLLTFITAGHETTALALTWAFYLLARHPEEEDRLLAEITQATGGAPLKPEVVPRLVRTRQAVQEVLRLYPPAPIIARGATRPVEVGGHRIAAGTTVLIPAYATHRLPGIWPDPHRFDPGRFAPAEVKARHRYAWIPFGAGPRICIGLGFAMEEATAILATLLPAIRLRPEPGFNPGLQMRITLRPARGMPMRITRR
ncbi:cytochrome P450 [Roseomonas sp. SSH11]|uniref:Cytochrome P450 n=1 Tax=Pararoseomonas baculiformis TaxID=2820812 RepID=A0ABS4AIH9_9PROT|nr:cytochrome P450 [Pararoseomonas baculiformis]MBP0446826.1 cytochrome P450 [Pararoseomonas baculiformis]